MVSASVRSGSGRGERFLRAGRCFTAHASYFAARSFRARHLECFFPEPSLMRTSGRILPTGDGTPTERGVTRGGLLVAA